MIASLDLIAPTPALPPDPVIPSKGRTIQELLATVSPSRLSTFLQCRLKFFFRYVSGISKPPSPALHVGTAVHAVLQQWNRARWRGVPMNAAAVDQEMEIAWNNQRGDDQPVNWDGKEEVHWESALALVTAYLRDTPIPATEKPEAVEVGVEMKLGVGLPTLVGIIDLVRQGGRIVDFKTSGQTPNPDKVRHTTEIQTTSYGMLYRATTGKLESAVEIHTIVKLKTPKVVITESPSVTDRQIDRFNRLIASYVRGVAQEDWVPSPGLQCVACEFFNECRRWI
jgi:hypothetical protein